LILHQTLALAEKEKARNALAPHACACRSARPQPVCVHDAMLRR
jgi:hypothetical protein